MSAVVDYFTLQWTDLRKGYRDFSGNADGFRGAA